MDFHCVKSVQIRSFFGPYFPAFGLNTDQEKLYLDTFHAVFKQVDFNSFMTEAVII